MESAHATGRTCTTRRTARACWAPLACCLSALLLSCALSLPSFCLAFYSNGAGYSLLAPLAATSIRVSNNLTLAGMDIGTALAGLEEKVDALSSAASPSVDLTLIYELMAIHSSSIAALTASVAALNATVQQQAEKISQQDGEIALQAEAAGQLRDDLTLLQQQRAADETALTASQAALQLQLTEVHASLLLNSSSLRAELSLLGAQFSLVQSQMNGVSSLVNQTQTQMEAAQASIALQAATLRALNASALQSQSQLALQSSQLTALQAANATLQGALAASAIAASSLQASVIGFAVSLLSLNQSITNLRPPSSLQLDSLSLLSRVASLEALPAIYLGADSTVLAISLLSGWSSYQPGSKHASATFLIKGGFVYLSGLVQGGSPFSTLFLLPSYARPPLDRMLLVDAPPSFAELIVFADGRVFYNSAQTMPYVSLDGIFFAASNTSLNRTACFPFNTLILGGVGGSLTVNPTSSVNCMAPYGGTYFFPAGTVLTLTVAAPGGGYGFAGWGGAVNGTILSLSYTTPNGDSMVSASFGLCAQITATTILGVTTLSASAGTVSMQTFDSAGATLSRSMGCAVGYFAAGMPMAVQLQTSPYPGLSATAWTSNVASVTAALASTVLTGGFFVLPTFSMPATALTLTGAFGAVGGNHAGTCTLVVASSLASTIVTVARTISYSMWGGAGGGASYPGVAGSFQTGTLAVVGGNTISAFAGGAGGNGCVSGGGGGAGYFGTFKTMCCCVSQWPSDFGSCSSLVSASLPLFVVIHCRRWWGWRSPQQLRWRCRRRRQQRFATERSRHSSSCGQRRCWRRLKLEFRWGWWFHGGWLWWTGTQLRPFPTSGFIGLRQ
jgi:hypothetical protein